MLRILAVTALLLLLTACTRQDPTAESIEWARSIRPLVQDYAVIQQQQIYRERADRAFERQLNAAEEAKIPYTGVITYPDNWPEISAMRDAGQQRGAANMHNAGQ